MWILKQCCFFKNTQLKYLTLLGDLTIHPVEVICCCLKQIFFVLLRKKAPIKGPVYFYCAMIPLVDMRSS